MYRTPAELGDDRVANLLDPEAALDGLAILLGQSDDAVASQEVRRRQHMYMQGVALYPFAAIIEPAQGAD